MKPKSFVLYARTTPPPPIDSGRAQLHTVFNRAGKEVGFVWVRVVPSRDDYETALNNAAKPRRGEVLLNTIPNEVL